MRIILLEPFFTGSHKAWAEQLKRHSRHQITILSMEGKFWKWRMHGGAVTLAREFQRQQLNPDLILATDMLDLSSFLALTRAQTAGIPVLLYFHENQLTYPWHQQMQRNNNWRHYAFINYISALSADQVLFNSAYHREAFLTEVPKLLNCYPDYREKETVADIQAKSAVLPLGLDLQAFDAHKPAPRSPEAPPLILWNHRWEPDKNPEEFARLLMDLHAEGYEFEVALLGEAPRSGLATFEELSHTLGDQIAHYGYAQSFAEYARWLWQADILPVTSHQDFFGASVVEAIYCGCYPLLPNRLAFPDHVPGDGQAVLYERYEELLAKMKAATVYIHATRQKNFTRWVAGYDWQCMIVKYDSVFEQYPAG
jgi:glycosyltransferase involved in cell wall biosynthesis